MTSINADVPSSISLIRIIRVFFRKYTNLAMLTIRAYVGKGKINSAKIVTFSEVWRIEPGISDTFLTQLTGQGLKFNFTFVSTPIDFWI